jgi:GntR family transcriptional repressor for pyruvate dehydrogenase complex
VLAPTACPGPGERLDRHRSRARRDSGRDKPQAPNLSPHVSAETTVWPADTETILATKPLYFVTNVSQTEDRAQSFWDTVHPGVDMNGSRPPKAAMLVARRIVADIARDNLKPGDLLPPERTMLEQYVTGRGTLREALRLLEFQGVIALKPGPRGGPVLLDPDASHLANAVVLLMQLKEAPFRTIMEVRSALEPVISALAATRISDEALAELYATIEAMGANLGDEHTFLEANKRFHEIIAWSSDNPLFGYIIDSLLDIMDGTVIGMDYPSRRRSAILKAHENIYGAIREHDPNTAEALMRHHIDEYVNYAERKFPEVLDQVIPWDRMFT